MMVLMPLMLQFALPDRAAIESAKILGTARRAKIEQYLVRQSPDLAVFSTCTHSKPSLTGIDWFSVYWDCPEVVKMPSNGTAFKFKPDSDEIVKVQATNVPVFSKVQPNG